MTLTFDTNLDKPYLATKENKQVVTAYFKSNTSKGKDILLHASIIFCWRYCRRCERRWPHDYNDDDDDDENRSNDDDINDFDEDNDSKSEVNHRTKVNDEPQKEKRWILLKNNRLRRRFALNSFTFLQMQNVPCFCTKPWYSYHAKFVVGFPFLMVTSFHLLFTLNVNSELQRNAA